MIRKSRAHLASPTISACYCSPLSRSRLTERHMLRSTSAIILLVSSVISVGARLAWGRLSVRILLVGSGIRSVAVWYLDVLRLGVIGRNGGESDTGARGRNPLVVRSNTVVLFAWWRRVLRFGLFARRWIATVLILVRHACSVDSHGEDLRMNLRVKKL
jgi:hypothetical protein